MESIFENNNGSLIIGDGVVGCALARLLKSEDRPVLMTSRSNKIYANGGVLDLLDPAAFSIPEGITTAYICAGISSKSICEADMVLCRTVNVTNTIQLIRRFLEKNIFVVFLSSVEVFSGKKSKYAINDVPDPVSVYGRLKVETENSINELDSNIAVIRLTKVLDIKSSIAGKWISQFQENNPIEAFTDVYISPISPRYAAEFILSVGTLKEWGVHHLSGDGDYSYYDIAKILAKNSVSATKILGITADIEMPRYASLSMQKNRNRERFKPQCIHGVIKSLNSE